MTPSIGDWVKFANSPLHGEVVRLFKCSGSDCAEVKVKRTDGSGYDTYKVNVSMLVGYQ